MTRGTLIRGAALLGACLLAVPALSLAQEEDGGNYLYATYFKCDASRDWMTDMIVDAVQAPIYDKAVDDGEINAWGWLQHHTGGAWRRVFYHSSGSLEALLSAQATLGKRVADENARAANELAAICPSHDDYIWRYVAGTGESEARAEAGFSVYFTCDMPGEDRADELVKSVFGPIYDKHVAKDGKPGLTSWAWFTHVVGGKWRRLLSMTAENHAMLLEARATILADIGESAGDAGSEFSTICGGHADYMWNVVHEKP